MKAADMRKGEYEPLLAAFPAYANFMKGTLMKSRGDLTKTQMDLIVSLAFSGKMSMGAIAEHLAIAKEQASRAVAPLEERGLVARSRSSENYRVVEVELTEAGEAFIASAHDAVERDVAERLAVLSPDDRARLLEASQTAVDVLRKL